MNPKERQWFLRELNKALFGLAAMAEQVPKEDAALADLLDCAWGELQKARAWVIGHEPAD